MKIKMEIEPAKPASDSRLLLMRRDHHQETSNVLTTFSSVSIKYIYASWDAIASLPNGHQQFGKMLFQLLSKTPLSEYFDETNYHHSRCFIQMIELLVHILSPTEFDILAQELFELGKRHARHFISSSDDFFAKVLLRPNQFQYFSDCFCQTLVHMITTTATSDDSKMSSRTRFHELRNLQSIQNAWKHLLSFFRFHMQRGAQSENLQMLLSSSSSNDHHRHREASYNFRMLSSSSNHHRTATFRPIVKITATPPTPVTPLATFQEQPQTTNEGPSAGRPSCQLVSPPRTTTTTTIGTKKKRTTRQRCYPYFHRNHDKKITHDDDTTTAGKKVSSKRSLFSIR